MSSTTQIVQKLWNYCNVLRDDGMSYGDYPSAGLRTGVESFSWSMLSSAGDVGHVCDTVGMTGWFQQMMME
jgi:hypothetical protein